MMPTKTRPLVRFSYLAFAPFSFSPAIVDLLPQYPTPSGIPTAPLLILISKALLRCDQFR
ncbi:hypothetical protein [Aeromonas veronii]|uniref:hypothetical protein n=1 Tax=Aeromonas veronii TaxID=654 RepID=UPI003D225450